MEEKILTGLALIYVCIYIHKGINIDNENNIKNIIDRFRWNNKRNLTLYYKNGSF